MAGRKKKSRFGLKLIAFVVLILCALVTYNRVLLNQDYKELQAQQQELDTQLAEEEDRTYDLNETQKYMQTKKYVEDVARKYFGLVYPDEILIEPEDQK